MQLGRLCFGNQDSNENGTPGFGRAGACRETSPIGLQKGLPGRLTPTIRNRLDTVLLEDISNRLIGDLATHVSQNALNPIVTAGGILPSHLHDELPHLVTYRRTARLLATLRIVPLPCSEPPVPAEKRVGRDDRCDLFQHFPAEHLGFDRQPAPLVVVQKNSVLAQFLLQHCILRPQILDGLSAFLGKSRGGYEVVAFVYFHTTSGRFCGAETLWVVWTWVGSGCLHGAALWRNGWGW